MTSYLIKALNQTGTYWAPSTKDGWGGKAFVAPTEVSVRWVEKQELFKNTEGADQLSQAVVLIDQDVSVGGYLYLGTSTEAKPQDQDDTAEIQAFRKAPNIRATDYVRKVWL